MRDWSHTLREPRVDARWSSWLLTCRKDRAGTRQVRYFWSFVEPDGARARVQHTEARLAHLTHELDVLRVALVEATVTLLHTAGTT